MRRDGVSHLYHPVNVVPVDDSRQGSGARESEIVSDVEVASGCRVLVRPGNAQRVDARCQEDRIGATARDAGVNGSIRIGRKECFP